MEEEEEEEPPPEEDEDDEESCEVVVERVCQQRGSVQECFQEQELR